MAPKANAADVIPKWKTAPDYFAGDKAVSPNGDVVSSIADHRSGAIFTPANWNLSPTYSTKAAVDTAYSMAVRGFPKKTAPLKKLWFNAGVAASGIVTQGAAGTVFNIGDTTTFALGDRSSRVTTYGTNGFSWMTKTGLVIHATAQYVRAWLQPDDITKVGTAYVFLGDDTFAHAFQAVVHTLTMEAASSIKSGDWYAFDIP